MSSDMAANELKLTFSLALPPTPLLQPQQGFSRFQTRERYGIRGSPVEDVLIGALQAVATSALDAHHFDFPTGAFCTTCSLVQESREIEEEEIALEQGVAPEIFYRDEEEQVQG